jgi:lipoyl-dependent peroxiredoxin subunit D
MSDLSSEGTLPSIDSLFENINSPIGRDLKLNLKRLLEEGALSPAEGYTALLATATAVEHLPLALFAREALGRNGMPPEQIQEAAESAAMMGMLNVYYRFRYMVGNQDDYRTAGLRMTALARPLLGKVPFEMLAFAVSVLNGCQSCIGSHEKVLREAEVGVDKIHDLARLAAVVKGLKGLQTALSQITP